MVEKGSVTRVIRAFSFLASDVRDLQHLAGMDRLETLADQLDSQVETMTAAVRELPDEKETTEDELVEPFVDGEVDLDALLTALSCRVVALDYQKRDGSTRIIRATRVGMPRYQGVGSDGKISIVDVDDDYRIKRIFIDKILDATIETLF